MYVDTRDNIYVGATFQDASRGQSATGPTTGANDRAIVIGNAITGELKYLIPEKPFAIRFHRSLSTAAAVSQRLRNPVPALA